MEKEQVNYIIKEINSFLETSNNEQVNMKAIYGKTSFGIIVKLFGKKETVILQEPKIDLSKENIILSKRNSLTSTFNIEDIEFIKIRYYKVGQKKKEIMYTVNNCEVTVLSTEEKTNLNVSNRASWICKMQELFDRIHDQYLFAKIYMKNGDFFIIAFNDFLLYSDCYHYMYKNILPRKCEHTFKKTEIKYKDDFILFKHLFTEIGDNVKSINYEVFVLDGEITRIQTLSNIDKKFIDKEVYENDYKNYLQKEETRKNNTVYDDDDDDDDD